LIVDPSASDIGAIDEADEWLQVQFGCGFGQNKLSTYHCNIASYNHAYIRARVDFNERIDSFTPKIVVC
jgi:hypothetical protein